MQSPLPANVTCLRADNPSPMTGTGTNSYLIEGDQSCVLIDPGPALPAHHRAIMAALAGRRLEAILITHAHLDHTALAPAVADSTGAPVLAFGDALSGRSAVMATLAEQGMTGGGEGADLAFSPDVQLVNGQQIAFAGRVMEVLHTPGHMGGHLCFAFGDILFSGDHVMGWSTSLVSPPDGDMAAYRASLDLLSLRPWAQMLPGHGAPITQPTARLAELTLHRRARETQVLTALADGPANAASLAARIYTESPAALLPAAARNVLAHLVDLHARNLITTANVITPHSHFQTI
jgi:glyoxylase-like metal-dependent hydrolase (beta-lactamase superfamily II)